jgi:hypothetical protein
LPRFLPERSRNVHSPIEPYPQVSGLRAPVVVTIRKGPRDRPPGPSRSPESDPGSPRVVPSQGHPLPSVATPRSAGAPRDSRPSGPTTADSDHQTARIRHSGERRNARESSSRALHWRLFRTPRETLTDAPHISAQHDTSNSGTRQKQTATGWPPGVERTKGIPSRRPTREGRPGASRGSIPGPESRERAPGESPAHPGPGARAISAHGLNDATDRPASPQAPLERSDVPQVRPDALGGPHSAPSLPA